MSGSEEFDVSIVTVVYNNVAYISECLKSVQRQKNVRIQHVIVDGGSSDGTLEILRSSLRCGDILISEPDNGIYDALNKGLERAEAKLVGILHSDDVFFDEDVVNSVVKVYERARPDIIYGDLVFTTADKENKYREWQAGEFKRWKLFLGWMPPHPTCFYDRSSLLSNGLVYDTSLKISADYKYLLSFFLIKDVRYAYLAKTITSMRSGGISNGSIRKKYNAFKEDIYVLSSLSLFFVFAAFLKRLIKVRQYL